MQKFGRKRTLVYSNIPWILGWLYLSKATNLGMLLLGSALVGFSNGFNETAFVVHTTETMEPRLRGVILTIGNNIGVNTGIFLSHIMGMCLSWQEALLLSAIVPLLGLLCTYFVLESPLWLLFKGRVEEARNIFFDLRGVTPKSKEEFHILLSKQIAYASCNEIGIVQKIFCREFWLPLVIITLVITVWVGSGTEIITYYAIDVLSRMSQEMSTVASLLVIDLFGIVSAGVSCFLMKIALRRTLFFYSVIGALISLIATIFALTCDLGFSHILITVCLCSYIVTMNLGITPVSLALIGEVCIIFVGWLRVKKLTESNGVYICLHSDYRFFHNLPEILGVQ